MTTTLTKSKDAAQPRPTKAKPGASEKLKKAARAQIAERLKMLGTQPSNHNEQAESPEPKVPKKPKGVSLAKKAKAARELTTKRMGVLDAAASVIATLKEPIGCKDLVAKVIEKGLWKSPAGKTPEATLYSGIIREIAAKGKHSRFKKVDRGLFAAGKST